MSVEEQLKKMQENLDKLLTQNNALSRKVDELSAENQEMKRLSKDRADRVEENKEKWVKINEQAKEMVTEMNKIKKDLEEDGVKRDYLSGSCMFNDTTTMEMLSDIMTTSQVEVKTEVKIERDVDTDPQNPFENKGREEKMDIAFGNDGECTARALRRFIDKYKIVKELNVSAKLTGWDKPEYRANKIKMALQGDAFDYVSLENTMLKTWTSNDVEVLEKLKDRYMNIQAIEVNILEFEKSQQEPKEPLNEFLSRLQRLVKDAYDGDGEAELEKKVDWRFVNGVRNENIYSEKVDGRWLDEKSKRS